MTQDSDMIIADSVGSYPSLVALRDAHGALLDQRRAGGDSAALLMAAEAFVQRGMLTGALLDGNEDRRAAQSLLNYWANILYRADRGPLDATLAEFDPLLAPELPEALCPYLGLDAFSEASAGRFFGRQELIGRMLDRLGQQRLLAVVGPSGSGKSSVMRAGLLPAIQGGALPDSESWRYLPPIVPGSDPLASLSHALRTENQEPGTNDSASILGSAVPSSAVPSSAVPGSAVPSSAVPSSAVPGSAVPGSPLVLVVDQFEEVFTLCEDVANRQAFITELLALAGAPEQPHRVILTMRSDFETFVARLPDLQPLYRSRAGAGDAAERRRAARGDRGACRAGRAQVRAGRGRPAATGYPGRAGRAAAAPVHAAQTLGAARAQPRDAGGV
jgi:Novel STAND NTPase 1